jgi:transcription antitermination factor NusG
MACARWAPGVTRLIRNGGEEPARVPDRIIDELRSSERNGLIELPAPPRLKPLSSRFKSGDRVRIAGGPLSGFVGLVEGMRPHQRVALLLQLLGRVEIAASAVERIT